MITHPEPEILEREVKWALASITTNKATGGDGIPVELFKKTDLDDRDNHDGVVTHLELDILECEVKRILGSIIMNKASGGDGNSS